MSRDSVLGTVVAILMPMTPTDVAAQAERILELIADAWDEGIAECCEVCFPPDNPYREDA